jgi:hypothetical protein
VTARTELRDQATDFVQLLAGFIALGALEDLVARQASEQAG